MKKDDAEKLSQFSKVFGEFIHDLRESKGLTQHQVELESGLSRQYIGYVENGKKAISFYKVWNLARGLKMKCSELIHAFEASQKEIEFPRKQGFLAAADNRKAQAYILRNIKKK